MENRQTRYRLLLALFALCAVVCLGVVCILGFSFFDLVGHWRICRYTLAGINPYEMIGRTGPYGEIPPGFSTVPWSCFLGSAFYGGFLPLKHVWIYSISLHLLAAGATSVALCRAAGPLLKNREWFPAALAVFVHFSYAYSLAMGNAGGILCCLLMLSILLAGKRPWLSGLLLALAMVKPQVTAVVCVIYLLNRRWKPLFFAAAIDIAGWAVTCLLTKTDPSTLLLQTFSSGTASDGQYLGLLSALRFLGTDSSLILLMNMALGLAYAVGGWLYLRRHSGLSAGSPALYLPACVASTFWMYKNGTDYSILSFCVFLFLLLVLNTSTDRKDFWLSYLCIAYGMLSRCWVYLGITLFDSLLLRDLFKSADGLLLALMGLVFCRMWIKYRGDELLPDTLRQS